MKFIAEAEPRNPSINAPDVRLAHVGWPHGDISIDGILGEVIHDCIEIKVTPGLDESRGYIGVAWHIPLPG